MPRYISSASDLVTSHAEICRGFIEQAVEKSKQATPLLLQAKEFLAELQQVKDIAAAIKNDDLKKRLLTAAGLSAKSQLHLADDELHSILNQVVHVDVLGEEWREEIVFRYLLIKGDTLGGVMRNITGAIAGRKFADIVLETLRIKNIATDVAYSKKDKKIQAILWKNRSLVLDRRSPLVKKNIDVILLDNSNPKEIPILLDAPEHYLACGELKGGIDPAGADEHWKTANSAIQRIRTNFKKQPLMFFVGAAIATSMANEIFSQLKSGELAYAANFTKPQQLEDLVTWLVGL